MAATSLPAPRLAQRSYQAIPVLTDDALFDATSVRIAFTGRSGGVSAGPYASLNLGSHVGDDARAVGRNREGLLRALGGEGFPLVTLNQVHGTDVLEVDSCDPTQLDSLAERSAAGADGVSVAISGIAALLCFADCAPVIVVSPSGRFAVAHAGWRGAVSRIASKAARAVARADVRAGAAPDEACATSRMNAYIGPHICASCFEVGSDVRERFVAEFGEACAPDARHVSLEAAISLDLRSAGLVASRIVSAGKCTACNPGEFFSYRASGGVCGRHGALAFRAHDA